MSPASTDDELNEKFVVTQKVLRAGQKARGFDGTSVRLGFLIARKDTHLEALGLAYAWLREEVTPLTVEGILFPT